MLFPAWQYFYAICHPSFLTDTEYMLIRVVFQEKCVCVWVEECLLLVHGDLKLDAFLVQLPRDLFTTVPKLSGRQDITCICFSPSEEVLVVSTTKNQLYMFTMPSADYLKVSAIFTHSTTNLSSRGYVVVAWAVFSWNLLARLWILKTHVWSASLRAVFLYFSSLLWKHLYIPLYMHTRCNSVEW